MNFFLILFILSSLVFAKVTKVDLKIKIIAKGLSVPWGV
jgi:hypothetical protein